jgi:hypothetical protein
MTRYQARREADALRPDAKLSVARPLPQETTVAEVAAAVRADRSLSEPQKHAALRAQLRRSAQRSEQKSDRLMNAAPK